MGYQIYKDSNRIRVFGQDQIFTKEDLKDLWENHKVLYLDGGIMAIWVEERNDCNPLVHLMSEDDGQIFWDKEKDICFDSYWIDNYIKTLKTVREKYHNE